MHIYRDAYTCEVMQYNRGTLSSSAHLGLCDSVVDEEGGFPAPVDWTGGVFCWDWKVMVVVMNRGLLMEEKGWWGGGGGFGGKGWVWWCGWGCGWVGGLAERGWMGGGRGEKEGVVRRSIGLCCFCVGWVLKLGGWGGWEMGDGRWEGGGRDWGNDKVGNEWEEALWY